jgi:hypothetical protein
MAHLLLPPGMAACAADGPLSRTEAPVAVLPLSSEGWGNAPTPRPDPNCHAPHTDVLFLLCLHCATHRQPRFRATSWTPTTAVISSQADGRFGLGAKGCCVVAQASHSFPLVPVHGSVEGSVRISQDLHKVVEVR